MSVRSAVAGDTVFAEIHWTGTKADGAPFEERGVLVMGIRDDRTAWGRLYAEQVQHEGADIDAVVRRLAGSKNSWRATIPRAAKGAAADQSGPVHRRCPLPRKQQIRAMAANSAARWSMADDAPSTPTSKPTIESLATTTRPRGVLL